MLTSIKNKNMPLYIFLIFYFIINLFYLDSFPFVHADEAWLASLSRAITIEKSLSATEDFFLLTDRYPHALKIIFHILQIPFIKISYSIISVRLFSLIISIINLYIFYLLLRKNVSSRKIIFFILVALSFDIQYIYISRFARQEIIILTMLNLNLYLLYNKITVKKLLASSIVTGLAIGIHPNSFIIFSASFFILFFKLFTHKNNYKIFLKYIITYISIVFLFAVLFISISLMMDNNFFYNYLQFGSKHGVTDIFIIKLLKLKRFYFKMFNRISGTYFLPDIRFQLFIFLISAFILTILSFLSIKRFKKAFSILSFFAGINAAYIIIGKYSPPSFSFVFTVLWFVTAYAADCIKVKKKAVLSILIFILGINFYNSINEILLWRNNSYIKYSTELKEYTNNTDRVFAPINTSFIMNYMQLASYNDIEHFKKSNISFTEYIINNDIEYIYYTDDLDIVYNERPLWNDLYGNIYPYYDEINSFIENKCELITEVHDNVYSVRIVDFMKKNNYKTKVYKVKK